MDSQAARGYALDPPGHALGISCDENGPSIGPIRLLRRTTAGLVPRPAEELDFVLSKALGYRVSLAGRQAALEATARALAAGDLARAMITTQFMHLPILTDEPAYLRALGAEALLKASPDDPVRPGWPAGTPDGKGGQFRPKDETPGIGHNNPPPDKPRPKLKIEVRAADTAARRAVRQATRRIIRLELLAILKVLAAVPENLVPGVGEAVDVAVIADLIVMAAEFARLKIDTEAAAEFVKGGPRTLAELQMGPEGEAFRSYDAFVKLGLTVEEALALRFGSAGPGYDYHHTVEQTNNPGVETGLLQNTSNIVRIPKLLHEAISAEYSKQSDIEPSMTVREWLRTQPYDVQWEWGLKTMRDVGILR